MSGEERGEPLVYAALGDSTGAGVGARDRRGYVARLFHRIERVRPGARLVNLCVSGATTADVLRAQVARVAAAHPTLLTLGIGINDLRRFTPEDYRRNYEEIIARLQEAAAPAPLVVSNLPDLSFAPAIPAFLHEEVRRGVRRFNEIIADVAARRSLFLVDVFSKSHEVVPTHPEFFSPDGFHPSDEGYEFWAHAMWPTVKRAIGEQ